MELLRILGQQQRQTVQATNTTRMSKFDKWNLDENSPLGTLMGSIISNDAKKLRRILEEKPELVNTPYKEDRVPVWFAIKSGRFNALRTLLELGADPNTRMTVKSKNPWKEPLLHRLCVMRDLPAAVLLIDSGADLHARNEKGQSVLQVILARVPQRENDPLPIFRFVVESAEKQGKPLDLEETTESGETLLHSACAWRFVAVAEYLISRKVSLDRQNNNGQTPLHVASNADYRDVVQLLLCSGANPNIRDCDGRIPVMLAGPTKRMFVGENFLSDYFASGKRLCVREHPMPKELEKKRSERDSSENVD